MGYLAKKINFLLHAKTFYAIANFFFFIMRLVTRTTRVLGSAPNIIFFIFNCRVYFFHYGGSSLLRQPSLLVIYFCYLTHISAYLSCDKKSVRYAFCPLFALGALVVLSRFRWRVPIFYFLVDESEKSIFPSVLFLELNDYLRIGNCSE